MIFHSKESKKSKTGRRSVFIKFEVSKVEGSSSNFDSFDINKVSPSTAFDPFDSFE